MWPGRMSATVVPPPATTILNAPQYLTGKVLGDAAAAYIKSNLGGKAKVVLLTHDSLQFLAPRFVAIRDSLRALPGATIVADISPLTVDEAGGAAMMRTILLAIPSVDVILGADTVVLGASRRCAKRARRGPISFSAASMVSRRLSQKSRRRAVQDQRQPRLAGFRIRPGAARR